MIDFSFYLAHYLQERILQKCRNVEIYIADNLEMHMVEIIVKDDARPNDSAEKLSLPQDFIDIIHRTKGSYKALQHKGVHTLSIELSQKEDSFKLGNFSSLLSVVVLGNPKVQISFSFISPKGEFVIESRNIIEAFSSKELMEKRILKYMNELIIEEVEKLKISL